MTRWIRQLQLRKRFDPQKESFIPIVGIHIHHTLFEATSTDYSHNFSNRKKSISTTPLSSWADREAPIRVAATPVAMLATAPRKTPTRLLLRHTITRPRKQGRDVVVPVPLWNNGTGNTLVPSTIVHEWSDGKEPMPKRWCEEWGSEWFGSFLESHRH